MISAVIPTLAGASRLARNLPSVYAALGEADSDWEVIVVDDGAGGIEQPLDRVRLVALPATRGYGPAVNAGAEVATGERLLILNDDVRLEKGTARILSTALRAEGVFAVVPRIVSPLARCGDEGGRAASWHAGLLEIGEAPAESTHATLYPVGCCFLCHRSDFLALGGFDDIFAPYLWEDVDLGYRAWRRGLATLHVPATSCHHEGSATIGQRPMDERLRLWSRNACLFHLRNVQDERLRAEMYGAWAAQVLFGRREPVLAGLADALTRYAEGGQRPPGGLSDRKILERVCAA
jgi:GT2 family glycosyltransferase